MRVTSPCNAADAVGEIRRPQRQCGHVELAVILAEREEASAIVGRAVPTRPADGARRDRTETHRGLRHGRVRRENRRAPDGGERLVETHALGRELVDALQDDERRMPFVQMPDRRRDVERTQRADAADAEDDFLLQPCFAIAAVEARGEVAILRGVLLEARVEQVQADAARPTPSRRW